MNTFIHIKHLYTLPYSFLIVLQEFILRKAFFLSESSFFFFLYYMKHINMKIL